MPLSVAVLADMPDVNNVKALTKHQYGYRLRVGNIESCSTGTGP